MLLQELRAGNYLNYPQLPGGNEDKHQELMRMLTCCIGTSPEPEARP